MIGLNNAALTILSLALGIFGYLFSEPILRLMGIPILGIDFILNGTVRAVGATIQVLILNLISFWVLRFPLTYLFAEQFGQQGIAYVMGMSFFISSIFAFSYYRYGKWRQKEVIKAR